MILFWFSEIFIVDGFAIKFFLCAIADFIPNIIIFFLVIPHL